MTDRTAMPPSDDAIPEADRLEQNLDVESEESEFEPPVQTADREAAEADLLEQSIPVPLDDEYDEPGAED
ncbi:hypothetical protein NONO_c69760 [Nocardia nova SH22a]|uniref:Uncharacterized protein n=1 Tax=Nocardia nova SH22a TaxID=1415166 RepID=W5TR48_9NOCA|nr:hypothetical protein [Nocardia nova]AHH21737.1 hypothetical protein NONO_c69760 [Nocardia nova SH22a]